MSLDGRVALVTGGSRGIGQAIAIALAAAGAHVAVNYREDAAGADRTVADIKKAGGHALAVRADVASLDDVATMIATVVSQLGNPAILVNNAGMAQVRTIDTLGLADFDDAIRVNLRSAFMVTAAVVPAMRQARWGRLIWISSIAANLGGAIGPHYAASKAGMLGLMHGYAAQLIKEGITSNAISPALIDTDMVRAAPHITPDRVPIGRFGSVDEVADIAVLLAQNGYLTGQTIHANGGMYFTS